MEGIDGRLPRSIFTCFKPSKATKRPLHLSDLSHPTFLFAIFTVANLPKQEPPSLPSLFSNRTGFNQRFPKQGGLLSLLND